MEKRRESFKSRKEGETIFENLPRRRRWPPQFMFF